MNIVLTGYRGTGKSAVARLLAKKLGWQSLSLDAMIVQQQGCTITEIVDARGWTYFRDAESTCIAGLAGHDRKIVDTGGGAILRPQNVQALRENGLVFWLKACPETIVARIKNSAARPAAPRAKERPSRALRTNPGWIFSNASITATVIAPSRTAEAANNASETPRIGPAIRTPERSNSASASDALTRTESAPPAKMDSRRQLPPPHR